MRQERGSNGNSRSSALWGKRSNGEVRSSALWGKGGRGLTTFVITALTLTLPLAAAAGPRDNGKAPRATAPVAAVTSTTVELKAFVTPSLLAEAKKKPSATFHVIVQGTSAVSTDTIVGDVAAVTIDGGGKVKKRFASISGVSANLKGSHILQLARKGDVLSITEDDSVRLTGSSSKQKWPYVTGVAKYWEGHGIDNSKLPAIAVVDSGIDASRADFGGRVVASVNLSSLDNNSPGDGRGHGTFVASIAAGNGGGYTGAAPGAKIVAIDVMDDKGMAKTSDVIAAADWILQNKAKYNIRVANFSLHNSTPTSFMIGPLNKAVQKLWFNGVVVVASAGNFNTDGAMSGMPFAPGNDPFVITVGALDTERSIATNDDFAAPWSAYGYTLDGFAKPELGAPGRYMVGAVPVTSTLPLERPEQVVAPGYMQLSGTSFAAPVVAGIAALLLAKNPGWTPDQVKGALMLSAKQTPGAQPISSGVGEVNAAAALAVTNPPNPNLALNAFVTSASGGSGLAFDAASWANTAAGNASWANASWANASWANASWANASWANASWANASWATASWANSSFANASWANALTTTDASWANNGSGDANDEGGYTITAEELALVAEELELAESVVAEVLGAVETEPVTTTDEAPAGETNLLDVTLGLGGNLLP